ncbi:MAG: glutathione peroxidase [Oscillospiraceae bacterium]|nr:glutathione peroxidase [Oscillospiraceae bacterium]
MSIYNLSVKTRQGEDFALSRLKGKVLLIVNTATGCGFTPQYEALEKLYETYHEQGLEVLDFPCNQFGHQAPGEDEEIHAFCTGKYKTRFDQFKKIDVNGETEDPLFTELKAQAPADEPVKSFKAKAAMAAIGKISTSCKAAWDIRWNFTKFLVDREGKVVRRISPIADPMELEDSIRALL